MENKCSFNKFALEEDSIDTIGDQNPTFEMQPKRVFKEDETANLPFKTIQKDKSPIGILTQNGGRTGSYTLYKSSKSKI